MPSGRHRHKGHREPSGRLSRKREHVKARNEMTEAEAKSVVIEARVRHGIPRFLADLSDAGRPNVGTLHGRMHLMGEIDRDQWEAAEWFVGRRLAWLRALDASPVYAPSEGEGTGDGIILAEAIAEWRLVLDCLQAASTLHRSPIIAAFNVILTREHYVERLVGDLRLGLNALHHAFLSGRAGSGLTRGRKSVHMSATT